MTRIGSHDLILACRALYAAMDRLDHAAATIVGVSRNDLRALNLLEHGPVSPRTLRRELSLTSGSVTTLIDRLERKGLARRTRDPSDRRGVLVEPTPKVFEKLAPLYSGFAQRLQETADEYGPDELADAARHIRDVCAACENALAQQDLSKDPSSDEPS